VGMMGAGLRPSGKPLDQPPYPKMQGAPHFYPDPTPLSGMGPPRARCTLGHGERYWGQHLWARGYWVASSGNVTDEVWAEYIKNQSPPEPATRSTAILPTRSPKVMAPPRGIACSRLKGFLGMCRVAPLPSPLSIDYRKSLSATGQVM